MLVDDYIIEVRDSAYIRQGQLIDADLTDLLVVPRANNIGSWQVVLPQNILTADGEVPHAMCALLRAPGSGLVVTNSRTGLVELSGPLTNASHAADTRDPGGTWTLIGVSDTTVLAESEAWPDPTDPDPANQDVSNDVRTAAAETLIHEFVDANIGPSATSARKNPRLTIGTDLGRGNIIPKSPRFKNLLTLCQEITTGTSLLFDIVQIGDQLELRTWEADDLTADIRMDLENGQLSSANYEYARPTLTHVNVLGQDQGVNRQVITRTSTESLAAAALWGVRIERSIDQRNTDDVAELEQSGDEALAEEGRTITSLRVVPSGDQTDNFAVGDFITVVVGGQEVPAQVTEMPISISAEGVFVGCTVGDPAGFEWESLLVSRQSAQEKRIAALERTVEVPASLYSQAEVDALFYTRAALDGGQLDSRYYTETEINARRPWIPAVPSGVASTGATATLDPVTGFVTLPAGTTSVRVDGLLSTDYEYEVELDLRVQSGHSTDNSAWMRMVEATVLSASAAYNVAGWWAQYNAIGGVYTVNGGNAGAIGAVSGAGLYVDFTSTVRLRPVILNGGTVKSWFYSFESFVQGSARGVRAGGYTPTATTAFDGLWFAFNGSFTGLAQGKLRFFKRKLT